MRRLRQIVTKAVIAKGKKRTESKEILVPANVPSSILGCWVINHQYEARRNGKYVEVEGKFEVNVWYAYNQHSKTAVHTEMVHYKDRIRLQFRDEDAAPTDDVFVKVLQQPNCIEAIIAPCGKKMEVLVEREFLVELVGETTVTISIHPSEADDDWPTLDESSSSKHLSKEHELESSSIL